ncbi:hypothetical protein JXC34_06995 [Candidatus Woesearchaeota archaeon]|nr:hypothetical protein [Candidatus Woesearchaeota archaeon]
MKKSTLQIINYIVLSIFLILIGSGIIHTFVTYSDGKIGPLYSSAAELDFSLMVFRRISGIITWLFMVGFSIYLAMVVINPVRIKKNDVKKRRKIFVLSIHWFILLNYFSNLMYSLSQIRFISRVMTSNTFEKLVIKRLYSIELYIALLGIFIYLLLTEIIPKLSASD